MTGGWQREGENNWKTGLPTGTAAKWWQHDVWTALPPARLWPQQHPDLHIHAQGGISHRALLFSALGLLFGLFVCLVCLFVCLFGLFVWLVCLFGLFVCLVGLFGLFVWFVWLVCLFVWFVWFVWFVCLVCLFGLFGWFVCLVCLVCLFGLFVCLVCLFVWFVCFVIHCYSTRSYESCCTTWPIILLIWDELVDPWGTLVSSSVVHVYWFKKSRRRCLTTSLIHFSL